ncbi:MAG: Gfo/Idh/MocA family protein [Oceanipulchritudo sp.]
MLKIAIVGTGGMANMHAQHLKKIDGVQLACACDIDRKRVGDFAAKHEIPAAYTDYAEMLREGDFAAVSVVTPDSTHAPLSLQAIEAGKHVLCEKPLATNAEDARAMAKAAKDAGVINMVNFSYRNSSAWQRAVEMIRNGDLGKIYHFQAHYLQSWLTSTDWGDWKTSPHWLWRLSKGHGSHGALGDVGVHIIDFATGPIGHADKVFCHLKTFDKAPENKIGDYLLDANDSALVTLECANGALGTLSITRWATGHRNSVALSVHGDRGALRLDLDKSYQMIEVCRLNPDGTTQPWQSLFCGSTPSIWERFVESIRTGTQDQPDFARGAEVQALLDACNASAQSASMLSVH